MLTFGIMFGRDRAGHRGVITGAMDDTIKAGGSKLQLRKGSLYLLLSIHYPDEELELDVGRRVAVRMGVQSVAVCAITGRTHVTTLSDRGDFLRIRRQKVFVLLGLGVLRLTAVALASAGYVYQPPPQTAVIRLRHLRAVQYVLVYMSALWQLWVVVVRPEK